MIVVLASIELNGGKREEFLAEFRRLVPLVRAEKGCIEYFPSVDHATHLPVQGPLRDEVVVVVEKWESVAALEAHLIAPHMMASSVPRNSRPRAHQAESSSRRVTAPVIASWRRDRRRCAAPVARARYSLRRSARSP